METEKKKKETARQALLRVLGNTRRPIAVHELDEIKDHSQNAMATELSDMARIGLVKGTFRPGTRFKEWILSKTP